MNVMNLVKTLTFSNSEWDLFVYSQRRYGAGKDIKKITCVIHLRVEMPEKS